MVFEFLELEYHKKISGKFEVYFFKEFEFLKLEFHGKLEFHKLYFQKGGTFLHIPKSGRLLIFFAR